jgi:beta-1,4-mannosyltransferase
MIPLFRSKKKADAPIKVLVYPQSQTNPYQTLLFEHLRSNNPIEIKPLYMPKTIWGFLFQIFIIAYRLLFNRLHDYRIVHIHWLYQLGFPGKPIWPWLSKVITSIQINLFLYLAVALGYKVIWTTHDVTPHHKLSLDDTALTQRLVSVSSKMIALSSTNLDEMNSLGITYDKRNVSVIPLGNYIDSYPNNISKKMSRQKLGIPQTAFVYLFFGTIVPYKNVNGMLAAFEAVRLQYSEAVLLVVGKVMTQELTNEIKTAKKRMGKSLRLHLKRVSDLDVQLYYNASDIAVHPFSAITNSSTVLLSASFAKPIVVPLLPAFKEVPKNCGIFYKADDPLGLKNSVLQAIAHRSNLADMSIAAHRYAESLSWDKIAKKTYNVYKDALDK